MGWNMIGWDENRAEDKTSKSGKEDGVLWDGMGWDTVEGDRI